MADDSDIPPLEDMTEIVKKAELIREQRFGSGSQAKDTKQNVDAKKRAKVTKKNVQSGVSSVTEEVSNTQSKLQEVSITQNKLGDGDGEGEKKACSSSTKTKPPSQGLFGGMKKGFLFGAPSKQTTKSSSNKALSGSQGDGHTDQVEKKKSTTTDKEDLPYITPSGKTESGLTLDEVQQAMSETKGLMDNQDWITDDLLTKIEKNDTLLKRFSDPKFMSALQEFQTNPESAMAKYKGNTEVEKFLMEFCGLLGDHLTNFGNKTETPQPGQKQPPKKPPPSTMTESKQSKVTPSTTPKIVEIGGDCDDTAKAEPKITKSTDKLSTVPKTNANSGSHIRIHDTQSGADMQEVPQTDDEAVKEVLNDPRVMEHLMDPRVMSLIKCLRENPAEGQRIVDNADSELKGKIRFLVSKGLLQFQMS